MCTGGNIKERGSYELLKTPALKIAEAVVQRCSVKKVFLEISQNLLENTYARVSFLIKLRASALQLY